MSETPTASARDDWRIRTALHELLAFSLRHPTRELAQVVVSGEWAQAAHEISDAAGIDVTEVPFGEAACDAKGLRCADADAFLHLLRAEATRLFVGTPVPIAYPYEGAWRALDDGVQPLLHINPASLEVERFCRACGLTHPGGTNEPLDHVATEFELMQYLAAVAGGIIELPEQGPSAADLPGGSAAAAFELFFSQHASTWIPRFASLAGAESRLPFYRIVAGLVQSAMTDCCFTAFLRC